MVYEILVTGRDGASQTFQVEVGAGGLPTQGAGGSVVGDKPAAAFTCKVDGAEIGPELNATMMESDVLSLLIGGKQYEVRRDQLGEQIEIQVGGERYTVEVRDPRSLRARRGRGASSDGPKKIIAPMPGKVIRILAVEGTHVEVGQGVIVIEAMKMQNELKSPKKGVVKKMMAVEGATVNPGDALAVVE